MRTPPKRILRQIADGNPPDLATWLNQTPPPLVGQLAAVLDTMARVNSEVGVGQKSFLRHQLEDLAGAMKILNRLIRRNSVQVGVVHTARFPVRILLAHQASAGTDSMMLLQVVQLSAAGRLDRLRRCRYCRRWFFSKRGPGKFCQESHRQSWHRQTPEGRAKWNKYMRHYRVTAT